jgi:hypothetical protein
MAAGEYLSRLRANSRYAVAVAKLNPQQPASLLEPATALRLEIAKLQWKVWLKVIAPLDADVQRLDALTRMFAERSGSRRCRYGELRVTLLFLHFCKILEPLVGRAALSHIVAQPAMNRGQNKALG